MNPNSDKFLKIFVDTKVAEKPTEDPILEDSDYNLYQLSKIVKGLHQFLKYGPEHANTVDDSIECIDQ